MELPKNVTQIGEVSKDCKVYVEDYVISYMKQLNQLALDKGMTVALYGRRREEGGVVYYFLYGACKMTSLQREVRHLSQAQRQEVENLRRKYFPGYTFMGYRLLNGEMVEGFHICEQEICRYIQGYAQFYEKNDSMLAYMLAARDEATPEHVDQEKYEEVKKRQEERRAAFVSTGRKRRTPERIAGGKKAKIQRMPASGRLQGMRAAAVSVFVLLCLAGFMTLQQNNGMDGISDLPASAQQWFEGIASIQPEEEIVPANAEARKDTLILEDRLDQALLEENNLAKEPTAESTDEPEPAAAPENTTIPGVTSTPENTTIPEVTSAPEPELEATPEPEVTPTPEPKPATEAVPTAKQPEAVAYVIKKGDTLTAISRRQYGNDSRVSDICTLNRISNPDDIKVGQIIMLPR